MSICRKGCWRENNKLLQRPEAALSLASSRNGREGEGLVAGDESGRWQGPGLLALTGAPTGDCRGHGSGSEVVGTHPRW